MASGLSIMNRIDRLLIKQNQLLSKLNKVTKQIQAEDNRIARSKIVTINKQGFEVK